MTKRLLSIAMVITMIFTVFTMEPLSTTALDTEKTSAEFATGMIDTDETLSAFQEECIPYSVYKQTQNIKNTRAIVPPSYDLSTSSYFPPIENQGNQGSCVAWATAYYQFTFAKNKLLGIETTKANAASPAWVYNLQAEENDKGMSYGAAYIHLKELGDVTLGEFPYDDDYLSWPSNETALINALNVRVDNYITLGFSGSPVTSVNSVALYEIKEALYSGNVLVASISYNSDMNAIYKYYNGKRIYYRGVCDVTENGALDYSNHAVSVVGYDDSVWIDINNNGTAEASEYGAFKVANSHGITSVLGNDGYFWVSYDSLNATSQVPGNWESAYDTVRRSMFTGSSLNENVFYMITVVQKNPLFIGKATFTTANRQNAVLSMTSSEISSYGTFTREQTEPYSGQLYGYAPFSGSLYLDLTPFRVYTSDSSISSIETTFTIADGGFHMGYPYEQPLTDCSYQIIDSMGTTLYDYSQVFSLRNASRSISKSFDMSVRGDVNYDGSINSVDAQWVLQYGAGTRELSFLQMYYADYNMNEDIDAADAMAILQAAT